MPPNETATAERTPAASIDAPLAGGALVAFTPTNAFELAVREAKAYAQGTLIPAEYQGNVSNCLIAMNMARRINADPLMVMQHLYIVHGKPGWSGQFLIAAFNQCGRYTTMRFEWRGAEEGTTDECGMRAYATEKTTGERINGPWVTWKMVRAEGWSKRNGSKWLTIPELMFHYRSAAYLVRTHAPEIAMGLSTADELHDVYDPIDVTGRGSDDMTTSIDRAKSRVAEALKGQAIDEGTGEITEGDKPSNGEEKQEAAKGDAPDVTYPGLAADIKKATNSDQLDAIADLFQHLPDERQRAELDVELRAKRKALAQ